MTSLPAKLGPSEAGVAARIPESLLVNHGEPDVASAAPIPRGYRDLDSACAVVYRLESGDHRQTGVLIEASVAGYRARRVRPHESTHPTRVHALAESLEHSGFEPVPVMLTYRDRGRLAGLLATCTRERPELCHTGDDGTTHTVWITRDAELVHAIGTELAEIDTLYIADGHHRMAAASRYYAGNQMHPAFTLAALFPANELRILSYHRCVTRPPEMSTSDLLDALAEREVTARIEECRDGQPRSPAPGCLTVYAGARWYQLWLRTRGHASTARDALDVVALDEGILAPLFGRTDITDLARVTPMPGGGNPHEIGRWCAAHDAIGFMAHPPDVEAVLAMSDAGFVLGPKSTWFAPKVTTGLFGRRLASPREREWASAEITPSRSRRPPPKRSVRHSAGK